MAVNMKASLKTMLQFSEIDQAIPSSHFIRSLIDRSIDHFCSPFFHMFFLSIYLFFRSKQISHNQL